MKPFIIALQFLTILPIRIQAQIKEEDFGKALLYFPVIGLLIGLLLSANVFLLSFLPTPVMAMLILIISVIITGGIHLDGFADTCDGFYGGGHKERVLEIMKDSHIGTIGVAGVVLLLLLKFSLIASFPEGALWKVLTLMSVFSRWSQGFACYAANYARQEGKAKYFIERAKKLDIFSGFLFTLALSYLFLKLDGLILCFVSFLPVFLFFQYIKKKLGGMTGDTIGAISEISEAAVLFFSSILYRINL